MRTVKSGTGDKALDALGQILELVHSSEPSKLRKSDLEKMRAKIIEVAMWGVGKGPEPVRIRKPKTPYFTAMQLVCGYEGESRFIRDLQRSIAHYGGLTPNQVTAVLAPPDANLVAQLRDLGVENECEYRFQARDAKTEAMRALRKTAIEGGNPT